MDRRGFLGSILALSAAPAIVRASSLMKIVVPSQEIWVSRDIVFNNGLVMNGMQFGAVGEGIIDVCSGDILSELQELTRKNFIPGIVVELYKQNPMLSLLLGKS